MKITLLPEYDGVIKELSTHINDFNQVTRKVSELLTKGTAKPKIVHKIIETLILRFFKIIELDRSGWINKNIEVFLKAGESIRTEALNCGYVTPVELDKTIENFSQIVESQNRQKQTPKQAHKKSSSSDGDKIHLGNNDPGTNKSKCCKS